MEDGRIPDDRLSASSCYQYTDCATRARLNQPASGGRRGAWCPKAAYFDPLPWVQADLGTDYRIEGVITQGRYPNYRQWIFQGNTDMNTEVTNMLPASVIARYVRIRPKFCHGHCCMRFELLGTTLPG
ncbi:EGF-like repeat and discoidin I-like domain-containing protein 3 [Diadema setosum]|uniref:EGF-like repeat and discoidin I-like domain-containing protein 3 n=1 Tax=Diadema setosum TaxID=31175 RepID=UPI003B3BD1D3